MHNTGTQWAFMSHRVNSSHLHLVETCTTLRKTITFLQAKFASVVRKLKALESKKNDHIKSVKDISCYLCNHSTQDCPTLPALRESLHEQLNVIDNFKRPNLNPYSQTYNSGWRNHLNFSWRNDNYAQPSQPTPLRQNFQNPPELPTICPSTKKNSRRHIAFVH